MNPRFVIKVKAVKHKFMVVACHHGRDKRSVEKNFFHETNHNLLLAGRIVHKPCSHNHPVNCGFYLGIIYSYIAISIGISISKHLGDDLLLHFGQTDNGILPEIRRSKPILKIEKFVVYLRFKIGMLPEVFRILRCFIRIIFGKSLFKLLPREPVQNVNPL